MAEAGAVASSRFGRLGVMAARSTGGRSGVIGRLWRDRSELQRVDLYTRLSLYAVHALFVAFVVFQLLHARSDARALVVAVAVVAVNLLAFRQLRSVIDTSPSLGALPPPGQVVPLVVGVVTAEALTFLVPADPRGAAALAVSLAVAFGFGAIRDDRVTAAAVVGCAVLAWLPTLDPAALVGGTVAGAFWILTMRASLWVLAVMYELDRARGAQAALAVAEERLRFSRDVHDVLGRHLSTIAVQAELAATLAGRGDATASERMLDVRASAHRALREARELARGYRAASLEQELDGARSLLRSAGITVDVRVGEVPTRWREAAAWVVREATTNVLRHSAATRVEVEYAGGVLRISNDHPNPPLEPGGAAGSGLTGLQERVAPLGGSVTTEHTDETFVVIATLGEEPS